MVQGPSTPYPNTGKTRTTGLACIWYSGPDYIIIIIIVSIVQNSQNVTGYIFVIAGHIRILHENERRFACDQCPRRFGERDGLLKHKSNVHEEQKCDVCLQMFENGKELK